MLFAISCTDKPNSELLRSTNRANHLNYLKAQGARLKAAGPYLDKNATKPTGSLLVIDAPTMEEAKRFAANDPYALAGVFRQVDIRPWRWLIGNPEK